MNSQRTRRLFLAILTALSLSTFNASVAFAGGSPTWDWQLPFRFQPDPYPSQAAITNAMGEGLHVGNLREAIDYFFNGYSSPVVAPKDGWVINVLDTDDFGRVLRIDHGNGVSSFFAHLLVTNLVTVYPRQFVRANQTVAYSGNTGTGGAGNHLHYEARSGATSGSVYSGSPVPMRGAPGNHWRPYYSPDPNFQQSVGQQSGAAWIPDSSSPLWTNDRHLSDYTTLDSSPPDVHVQFDPTTTFNIHLGASPSTPGNPTYQTEFRQGICRGDGCPYLEYQVASFFNVNESSRGPSDSTGKHVRLIWVYWPNRGVWSSTHRVAVIMPREWNPYQSANRPGIAIVFDSNFSDPDTLVEYAAPGATFYYVYYSANFGPYNTIYSGPAGSFRFNRNVVNATSNRFFVTAYFPNVGWVASNEIR